MGGPGINLLQPFSDLLEIVTSQFLFLSFLLFFGRKGDGLRRQRKHLIEGWFISQERAINQRLAGFAQSGQIDLQKRSHAIIVIEAQAVTIRDGDQKEIEENLDHGKLMEEPSSDKTMIDPTEGAFDLSNSVRTKDSFDGHGPYLPVQ